MGEEAPPAPPPSGVAWLENVVQRKRAATPVSLDGIVKAADRESARVAEWAERQAKKRPRRAAKIRWRARGSELNAVHARRIAEEAAASLAAAEEALVAARSASPEEATRIASEFAAADQKRQEAHRRALSEESYEHREANPSLRKLHARQEYIRSKLLAQEAAEAEARLSAQSAAELPAAGLDDPLEPDWRSMAQAVRRDAQAALDEMRGAADSEKLRIYADYQAAQQERRKWRDQEIARYAALLKERRAAEAPKPSPPVSSSPGQRRRGKGKGGGQFLPKPVAAMPVAAAPMTPDRP